MNIPYPKFDLKSIILIIIFFSVLLFACSPQRTGRL